ncbi:MAG: hypothetical protein Kow00127_17730 [Bacteroidales bacterium]
MKALRNLLILLLLVLSASGIAQQINKAEYYIGNDPGFGNGFDIPVTPGDSVNLDFSIDLAGFPPGEYQVCLRTMDESGIWSGTFFRRLIIEPENKTGAIIALEYFYDTDPGIGQAELIPVTGSDSMNLLVDIPVPEDLPFGDHRLYIRTLSEDSLWSTYISHYLTVCDDYGPVASFNYQISTDRWVGFEDNSSNANSWFWDFGDGHTDTTHNPVHQYDLPGNYTATLIASNNCGPDTSERAVNIRGILFIESNKGTNTGAVTLNVTGFGLTSDSEVLLVREGFSTIYTDTLIFESDELLRARFDLQGKEPGYWDVHVILPSDTTFIVNNGFEIVETSPPDLLVAVYGRYRVLINRDNNYHITVQNRGFEDAVGIPFVIRNIPENVQVGLDMIDTLNFWTNPYYSGLTGYILSENLDTATVDFGYFNPENESWEYAFVIPYIPANSSLTFTVAFNLPEIGPVEPEFKVAPQGFLTSASLLSGSPVIEPLNCRNSEFISAFETALDTTFPGVEWDACFDEVNQASLTHLRQVCLESEAGNNLLSYRALNGAMVYDLAECLLGSEPDTADFINIMSLLNLRFNTLDFVFEEPQDCENISFTNPYFDSGWNKLINPTLKAGASSGNEQLFNPFYQKGLQSGLGGVRHCMGCVTMVEIEGAGSLDPNEKSGPGNNPYDNYLNNAAGLNYTINFENIGTATAAAVQVKIVDTLNPEKYDLTTFEFGNFGFSNSVFTGTATENELFAIIDLRPERPCYLKMEGYVDTLTGYTEWLFSSLDTLTLQLTLDPDGGFLPPNANPPEGEGFVNFSVSLREDIESGEFVANDAEIIFDSNDPIVTNEWINIYDNDLPESQVLALPDTVYYESFPVEWSGSDQTSGVEFFDVVTATVNGTDTTFAFFQYLGNATTAEFSGEFGERYYFFSVAVDSAGNIEPEALAFDTEVFLYNPCWDTIVVNHEYEICEGDSINIQGTWRSVPGIYSDTLISVYGCDSLIISQLDVLPLPAKPEISWDGTYLSSTPADSYQWYLNDTIINGATNQTYEPAGSGIFKVEISEGNVCTVFSDDFELILSVADVYDASGEIRVFPNPATGYIVVDNLPGNSSKIEIFTATGMLTRKHIVHKNKVIIHIGEYKRGVYFLKIDSGGYNTEKKIIVN